MHRRLSAAPLAACLLSVCLLSTCLLSACDREPPASTTGDDNAADMAALPRPDATGGSVTGFDGDAPKPRAPATSADAAVASEDAPGTTPSPGDAGLETVAPPESTVEVPPADVVAPALPAPAPAAPPEPGAAEAAAVVRTYYASINARQYPRAYALWSDGGRASGQTPGQFAGGFSDTAKVTVSTGEPGRVEGAAGSRYVTIPVAVEAVQADGSVRHYDGTYTLRRAVVDGATAQQRQWRISDADLRQVE
jgi:hypothetical protein